MLVVCLFVVQAFVATGASAAISPDQQAVLDLTNLARAGGGIGPLALDEALSGYARRHSRAMVERNKLFHTTNFDRVLRGTGWKVAGENVGYANELGVLQDAWMASSAHRKNIMKPAYDHVAIGVVKSGARYWVTVIFYGT